MLSVSALVILKLQLLEVKVKTFLGMSMYRHVVPKKIKPDRGFFKSAFETFCKDCSMEQTKLGSNDHEANRTVERANRTIRSFFLRVRLEKPKASISDILREIAYSKNICKEYKISSSFEFLSDKRTHNG